MNRPSTAKRGRGRPPGPPVDAELRREQLLDAAETAIRRSGSGVGLAEVATEAGLTRSAVYAAFADRDALIDALAQRHAKATVARLLAIVGSIEDSYEQTRASVDVLAGWFEDEPVLAPLLVGRMNRARTDRGSIIISSLVDILRLGFTTRDTDPAPAEPWAYALVGAVSTTMDWWSRTRTLSRTEVVDHVTALIWGGFSAIT